MPRTYAVYILANRSRTLYVGITGDLLRRIWQHRTKQVPGFTRHYDVTRLVYFEQTGDPIGAIEREKQLKRWSRHKKVRLIERANPDWTDLAVPWFEEQTAAVRTTGTPPPGRGSLDSGRSAASARDDTRGGTRGGTRSARRTR